MSALVVAQGRDGLPLETAGGPTAALELDLDVYSLEAVLRACYKFTDRCYLLLARSEVQGRLRVFARTRGPEVSLEVVVGEFVDELLDQQLRRLIGDETTGVREVIVAQAFAEGNLLDEDRDDGDYEADPRGVGRRR